MVTLERFKNSTGVLPTWYNLSIHVAIVKLVIENKRLEACKYLCDISKENKTNEVFNLRWSKDEVVDRIRDMIADAPNEQVVDKVADKIIEDLTGENFDSSELRTLLAAVPKGELHSFLIRKDIVLEPPEKKAVIVSFMFRTRVVVPSHYDEGRILSCAATNIQKKIDADPTLEFNSNFLRMELDSECPYNPDIDKDGNFGVWRGQ